MQTPLFKDHHGTKNKVYAYTVVVLVSLLRALCKYKHSFNSDQTRSNPANISTCFWFILLLKTAIYDYTLTRKTQNLKIINCIVLISNTTTQV